MPNQGQGPLTGKAAPLSGESGAPPNCETCARSLEPAFRALEQRVTNIEIRQVEHESGTEAIKTQLKSIANAILSRINSTAQNLSARIEALRLEVTGKIDGAVNVMEARQDGLDVMPSLFERLVESNEKTLEVICSQEVNRQTALQAKRKLTADQKAARRKSWIVVLKILLPAGSAAAIAGALKWWFSLKP